MSEPMPSGVRVRVYDRWHPEGRVGTVTRAVYAVRYDGEPEGRESVVVPCDRPGEEVRVVLEEGD